MATKPLSPPHANVRIPRIHAQAASRKPRPDNQSFAEISASREHLELANASERCGHIKANGLPCGSPALRGSVFCYYHDRFYNRPCEDSFPPLEDANAVQVALDQVLARLRAEAFKPGAFDRRLFTALLYGLQTASANAKRTKFDSSIYRNQMVTDLSPSPKPPQSETVGASAFKPAKEDGQ